MSDIADCPKCGSDNLFIEKHPNGDTACRSCGYSRAFKKWPREGESDDLDIDGIRFRADNATAPGEADDVLAEDVPALCDEMERLREENARLRDRLHILADNIATRGVDSDPDAIIDRVLQAREGRGDRKHERKRLYVDREDDDE